MMPPNMPPPPGGGAPPMPGPAPAMPQAGGAPDQVLLQRFQSLSPAEHDALDSVSPEAARVIMKLVPELGPVIQMVLDDQGGSEGTQGDTDNDAGAEPDSDEDDGAPVPPSRPKTMLGRIG